MKIVGQTEFWVKMKSMKKLKKVHALVAEEAGDEVLLDLDTLIDWSIIPKSFPLPMDENERETKKKVQKMLKSAYSFYSQR